MVSEEVYIFNRDNPDFSVPRFYLCPVTFYQVCPVFNLFAGNAPLFYIPVPIIITMAVLFISRSVYHAM